MGIGKRFEGGFAELHGGGANRRRRFISDSELKVHEGRIGASRKREIPKGGCSKQVYTSKEKRAWLEELTLRTSATPSRPLRYYDTTILRYYDTTILHAKTLTRSYELDFR